MIHRSVMEENERELREQTKTGDLPPELFHHILKKIPDIGSFFRCRAVCKPWRFSTSLSDLGPQFPLLVKLNKGPASTDLEFYSIALDKVYTIPAPVCSGKRLVGQTAGGYMLACQLQKNNVINFSLVNPLINREVPLPDLRHQVYSVCQVSWICPSSFKCDDYIIITCNRWHKILAFCKPGDERWNIIGSMFNKRCFYLKGLLFMIELRTGVTKVMDIAYHQELYDIPPPKSEKSPRVIRFLVESCGDIFGVCHNSCNKRAEPQYDVYRLEFGNGEGHPSWVKVRSIGDRILFLDIHTGHGFCLSENNFGTNFVRGFISHIDNSFRSCDFAAFRRNSIYFIRFLGLKDGKVRKPGYVHAINIYDIENDQTFYINSPFNRHNFVTWFLPTLNHI
ncbi:F-box protein [Rhynchospora pubera]|uniref:F-box protein n=1 Tax=Rhynchospora pubera TaxID=906938 RepID=A0AAV8DBE9_9POAL|nr:F-box protein [Rhynchospora pubera]